MSNLIITIHQIYKLIISQFSFIYMKNSLCVYNKGRREHTRVWRSLYLVSRILHHYFSMNTNKSHGRKSISL